MNITYELACDVSDQIFACIQEELDYFGMQGRISNLEAEPIETWNFNNQMKNGAFDVTISMTYQFGDFHEQRSIALRLFAKNTFDEEQMNTYIVEWTRRSFAVILLKQEFFDEYMIRTWMPRKRI